MFPILECGVHNKPVYMTSDFSQDPLLSMLCFAENNGRATSNRASCDSDSNLEQIIYENRLSLRRGCIELVDWLDGQLAG